MPNTVPNDQLMVRYLLGQNLTDTEQNEFESQLFSGTDFVGQLQAMELELVARYERGDLSPHERELFEKRFLIPRERRDLLTFVKTLFHLAEKQSETPGFTPIALEKTYHERSESKWVRRWKPFAGWSTRELVHVGVAILVLIIVSVPGVLLLRKEAPTSPASSPGLVKVPLNIFPPEARVQIGQQDLVNTNPLSLETGPHRITISAPGYRTATFDVNVTTSGIDAKTLALAPLPTILDINKGSATVRINNQMVQDADLRQELLAGDQEQVVTISDTLNRQGQFSFIATTAAMPTITKPPNWQNTLGAALVVSFGNRARVYGPPKVTFDGTEKEVPADGLEFSDLNETPKEIVFVVRDQTYPMTIQPQASPTLTLMIPDPDQGHIRITSDQKDVEVFVRRGLVDPTTTEINDKLRLLCRGSAIVFEKFPFTRSSPQDATLDELSALFAPEAGQIWKFQTGSLAALTQLENSQWKFKDPSAKPQVTPEMLAFLNRAQLVKDGFYPKGATRPQLTYVLRPELDSSFKPSVVEIELDGQLHRWDTVFQKQFSWPAAADQKPGALARVRTGPVAYSFTSHAGIWGIFRMMADAEPRAPKSPIIEWKYTRLGGQQDPIQPAPVRMSFPEFPNGIDVFHPQFLEGIRCPAVAVQ